MGRSCDSDANDNNMVKRDEEATSVPHIIQTVPSAAHPGHILVPTVSTCQELLDTIRGHRGEVDFITEILKRSSVDFTDNQLVLVQDVLEGAYFVREYRIDRRFVQALTALEESLGTRVTEEKSFFFQQRKRYTEIYEILRQTAFPYSARQAGCLNRMVRAVYLVTGHPDSDADQAFADGLRELVRLLHSDDHLRDSTPRRIVIMSTIHFYLKRMVTQLDKLAKEEAERHHPDFIHPHSEIDLASYLVINLDAVVDIGKILTPREHFHYGMVEVYTKLVDIFKNSGLDFNYIQEVTIQKIERRVRDLRKDPLVGKHHGIAEACLEFMSELEENNPDREVTLEGDKIVWATEGIVNKAVREIGWSLIYLQPVASGHLVSFPCWSNGIENVVTQIMERFLALYPLH